MRLSETDKNEDMTMTTTAFTTRTLIVTRELDNATADDIQICDTYAEAENMQLALNAEDAYTIDATAAVKPILRLAAEYLRDVIRRQSQPHASIIVQYADEHLDRVESLINA